jgi:hypothetical protein
MKHFHAEDGRSWRARLHDGVAQPEDILRRVGWEAIVFESAAAHADQRFVYRPAGWLDGATDAELREAVREAESIRTSWGAPAR